MEDFDMKYLIVDNSGKAIAGTLSNTCSEVYYKAFHKYGNEWIKMQERGWCIVSLDLFVWTNPKSLEVN